MKTRLAIFILGCIITSTFATRHYTPHKKKVEVTYTDGDKVIFLTRYTTMEVTDLYVISRNGIQYTIPTNYLANIKRPQIETVSLSFKAMGEEYVEGSFYLVFRYGSVEEKDDDYPFADYIFEKGKFYNSFDSLYKEHGMKKLHNQNMEPMLKTPAE